jgi:uncharacterized protein (DUF488 family)
MATTFFTIGHSTRSIEVFVGMLHDAGVELVADVRTVPRSRTNPQYNGDVLPTSLSASQIGYEHIAALGGLRGRQPNVPTAVNAFWSNQSFHNFADYALVAGPAAAAMAAALSSSSRQREIFPSSTASSVAVTAPIRGAGW